VILVNLLPHREEARKRREQQFKTSMLLALLVGLAVCVLIWAYYKAKIAFQNERNERIEQQIGKLDEKIKNIATLRGEIAALQVRQQAVEDLQADRNLPVHLLEELVKQMPDGTYITSIKQQGADVTIDGVAQSQERVSQLLTNMGSRSEWFAKPDLIQIQAKNESISAKESRRVYAFSMKLTLVKPSDVQKAADEANKTASSPVASPAKP
jgi:type IV pilus assembly protein PilN